MKKKTCSIEEATEWLAKTCPNTFKLCTTKDTLFMAFRKHRNSFEPLKTPHKRTHRKGSKIRSIATFRKWCMNGGPIYYNHKFMHYGFAVSIPFRGVCDALSQGRIWKAVKINA